MGWGARDVGWKSQVCDVKFIKYACVRHAMASGFFVFLVQVVDIPLPPSQGDFDINAVLGSSYFFN